MSTADEVSPASTVPPSSAVQPAPSGSANDSSPERHRTPSSPSRAWSIVLAAGVLAGLAGFGLGEAAPTLLPPDLNLPAEIQRSSSQKPLEIERRMGIARDRQAVLAYGGLGLFLGLALGVAGGLLRRSASAAVVAGLTGLVLGAAAGALTTQTVLPHYHAERASATDETKTNDLALALLTHGAIWCGLGVAAGFAFGLGRGGWGRVGRAALGGLLGAVLAAAVYEFAGAIVFPTDQTFRPMAFAAAPRLLAHLSVAMCVAAATLGVTDYVTTSRDKAAIARPD